MKVVRARGREVLDATAKSNGVAICNAGGGMCCVVLYGGAMEITKIVERFRIDPHPKMRTKNGHERYYYSMQVEGTVDEVQKIIAGL